MGALPLSGVTALDFGQVYNGPYCGFLLAQAGARVIKVESPQGETLRGRAERTSSSYPFALLNTNKECLSLNIKSEQGQRLLKRLVHHVDVVFENFAPGTLEKYGIGARALRAENPRLIYASSTGYGNTGRNRDFRGMDITIQATTGVMSITGDADDPPMKSGPALADFLGGVHLFGAISAALVRQARADEGTVIDVSMQDCVFPALSTALGAYFQAGEQLPRVGNRHAGRSAAPYNVYRASDGHVAMICIREGHWRGLITAMDQPELKDRPEFADMAARCAHLDLLDQTIESWTSTLPKAEVVERTQREGVICAPVLTLEEVVNDPHLHERGTLHWYDHPKLGRIVLASSPLRFGDTDLPEVGPVPDVGAHNEQVYGEFLGLSAAELDTLRRERVI